MTEPSRSSESQSQFALAFEMPETWFNDKVGGISASWPATTIHPCRNSPGPASSAPGAHTDCGAMTILAMSEAAGGLEVMMPDGAWVPVAARPNELVINLEDMMARWTNGRWASTLHRVANPPVVNLAESRLQSIGYFVRPDYDAPIKCIPTCLADGAAPRFPEITAEMHIRRKIEQSHKAA